MKYEVKKYEIRQCRS